MSTHSDILRVKQERFFKKERLFKTLLKVSERHLTVCESFEACKKAVEEQASNQTSHTAQQQAIALAREGYNRVSEEESIAKKNWMRAREAYYAADTAARCYETFMEAEEDLAEMRKILKRRVTKFNEEGNITQEEVNLARQVHRYAVDSSIEAEENWMEAQKHADAFSSDMEDDENLQQIAAGFFDEAVGMPSTEAQEAQAMSTLAVLEAVAQTLSGIQHEDEEEPESIPVEAEEYTIGVLVEPHPNATGPAADYWLDPRNGTPNPPPPANIQPHRWTDHLRVLFYPPDIAAGIIVESLIDARVATAVVNGMFETSPRQIVTAVTRAVTATLNRVADVTLGGLLEGVGL